MPEVDVRLVEVTKRFGDVLAVDHINLEVQDGEFFSLLGPSGCGKTTTLRMIGGFEEPSSGLIELHGQDVTWLPPYRRNVNTVFQNYALFPHLSIYENVAFGLRRKGVKTADVKARVTDMLRLVELPGYEKRKPSQISGGQAQRVALARALINRPAVLLLDEPLGALDLKLRKQMQVELKRIQQEVGITFIYVTHDQEEAMTMSDRIAVMSNGRYEQLGDPEELYERPRTRFVAGFLGVSNLLRGRIEGGRRRVRHGPSRLRRGHPRAPGPHQRALGHRGRGTAREDPPVFRGRRSARRSQPAGGRHQGRQLPGREHPVHRRDLERRGRDRVRAERGAHRARFAPSAGGAGPVGLVTGAHLRSRWRRARAGQRDGTGRGPGSIWRRGAVGVGLSRAAGAPGSRRSSMTDYDQLTSRPISRRRMLQGAALAGFGAFLAACTGSAPSASPTAAASTAASLGPSPTPVITPVPQITGPLNWANWPAYIDLVGAAANAGAYSPGSSPTLEAFKKKYSVDVKYVEDIQANEDFFKQKLEAQFVAGQPTGWDLIVLTDWMAAKLVAKQWLEKLDQSAVPNCTANLRDALRNQRWDPTNDYHYPWQSGMTGMGYDSTALSKANIAAPTKLADLWNIDPKKVTFLTEKRDTFGLGLLKLGKDTANATADDLQAVHDDMKPLVDKGLRFTGNEYLQDFASRKTWAAMVWSGDLANSGAPDQKFVFPAEGTMIWTDNMLIPKGAANKYTAELMMNWVYDPKIAANIADYVKYVSPVKGADTEIEAIDKGASSNPLMFPTPEIVAKQRVFQDLTADLETKLNELYSDLAGA